MIRRHFLKSGSMLTAAGFFAAKFPFIAGPFTREELDSPGFFLQKKLNPEWIRSLYERGEVTRYAKSRNELQFIGMPAGGICCGGVYVGGDGRLWLWDIFNQNQTGVIPKKLPVKIDSFGIREINNTEGTLYLEPLTPSSPIQTGLALLYTYQGTTFIKRLQQEDWEEVLFQATYPVATITYLDSSAPVEVSMQVFSPFIPGNAKDSGMPVTIRSITVRNTSDTFLDLEILGWLENRMLCYSKDQTGFTRKNQLVRQGSLQGISLDIHTAGEAFKNYPDYGNMFFHAVAAPVVLIEDVFQSEEPNAYQIRDLVHPSPESPVAGILCKYSLEPGRTAQADFIISWYTPNSCFKCSPQSDQPQQRDYTVEDAERHFYTTLYAHAQEVAQYVNAQYEVLKEQTLRWKETWYDSTLPWWFLERTFLNISTLATTTTHRFQSGRYYAWEGVGCCHGNCTHVYQYAHAAARIFPELERDTRERVDLGIGYDPASGMIRIRGEKTGASIDGQAGTILRIYREHQMTKDNSFLQRNWPKIKKAVEFVILQDKNQDGMEDTPMENTLDALWHGEISWIVGLCIAAVRAGQAMAEEMADTAFAARCRHYVHTGSNNMESLLFNGEFFIHRPDPSVGKKEIGSFNTCHIDQVYGQSWAWQVNLGRILSKEKTRSALESLWKYNYLPDVGPYFRDHPGGRFYALAGEGGMVMNTNPLQDKDPYGNAKAWQVGYFSECMSGFEHQVASHMMAEGMVEEALVLTRTIHDRYHGFKRNPFNEIECSDHYGRAMASYGTFISACGYTYHGPKGLMGFSPRLHPEDFKAPFTSAEGWGSYTQKRSAHQFHATLTLKQGALALHAFSVCLEDTHRAEKVEVFLGNQPIECRFDQQGSACTLLFAKRQHIRDSESLILNIY